MKEKKDYTTAISLLVAALIIGGAIYVSTKRPSSTANNDIPSGSDALKLVNKVTDKDHIKGNPDAKVKIIEYSDYECPFCKRFHFTMNRIMQEYGDDVAWVYRHFPLDTLHPKNARKVAVAAECAEEIGGKDAFWKFTDGYFNVTPSNDQTNLDVVIPQLVKQIGLDKSKFDTCVKSGKYDSHIQDEVDNAVLTGGRGTPWSILVTEDGKYIPINGAQPYEALKQIIEAVK